MTSYQSRFFLLEEYLPQDLFERLAKANALWKGWLLMDERQLRTDDALRAKFGQLLINNWHQGGPRHESGLRLPGMTTFKETSQHSYGRASDKVSPMYSGEEMRTHVLAHPDDFPLLTRMERGTTWLHTDVGNAERIALVDP